MDRPARSTAALLAVLCVTACSNDHASDERLTETAPEPDALMLERIASIPKDGPWPMSYFQPRDTIEGADEPTQVEATDLSDAPEAIREAFDYATAYEGRALIVWKDGAVAHAAFPGALDDDDWFNSYHMHWLPLVLAVGVAVDDGDISLDAPISTWIDEWADDSRGAVTMQQLLNMTAGFELYRDSSDPTTPAAKIFFGSKREAAVLDWPLAQAPGSLFEYNYIVPEVIGLVLERATGTRYADYVSSRLWRALGNGDAEVWLDSPGGRAYQNAALFAAPRDWLNLGKLMARRGVADDGERLLSEAWFDALTTGSEANPNFGFVWLGNPYIEQRRLSERVSYFAYTSEPFLADDVIIVDGYVNRLFVVPSRELVVVYVGKPGWARAGDRGRWDDAALLNPILAAYEE